MTLLTVVVGAPLILAALIAVSTGVYLLVEPALAWRRERKSWPEITRTREAARLARQCDEQDAWYRTDDSRGTYGSHYHDIEGHQP